MRLLCATHFLVGLLAVVSIGGVPTSLERMHELVDADDTIAFLSDFDGRLQDGRASTTSVVIVYRDEGKILGFDHGIVPELSKILSETRPLRKGQPFVEVGTLNKANKVAFNAFRDVVIPSQVRLPNFTSGTHTVVNTPIVFYHLQVHLNGVCVECSSAGSKPEILAFSDGKLVGAYPDTEELLSCTCSCGKDTLCPDHECCTDEGACNHNDASPCLPVKEGDPPQQWREKHCWPPSCSQTRAAMVLTRWLKSVESHNARRVRSLYSLPHLQGQVRVWNALLGLSAVHVFLPPHQRQHRCRATDVGISAIG